MLGGMKLNSIASVFALMYRNAYSSLFAKEQKWLSKLLHFPHMLHDDLESNSFPLSAAYFLFPRGNISPSLLFTLARKACQSIIELPQRAFCWIRCPLPLCGQLWCHRDHLLESGFPAERTRETSTECVVELKQYSAVECTVFPPGSQPPEG